MSKAIQGIFGDNGSAQQAAAAAEASARQALANRLAQEGEADQQLAIPRRRGGSGRLLRYLDDLQPQTLG